MSRDLANPALDGEILGRTAGPELAIFETKDGSLVVALGASAAKLSDMELRCFAQGSLDLLDRRARTSAERTGLRP